MTCKGVEYPAHWASLCTGFGNLSLNLLKPLALVDFPERYGGNPTGTVSCITDLAIQLVDLLQGESLGLVDHEVNKCNADEAATAPDEENLGLQIGIACSVIDEVWGGVCDGPIQKPIGGRGY